MFLTRVLILKCKADFQLSTAYNLPCVLATVIKDFLILRIPTPPRDNVPLGIVPGNLQTKACTYYLGLLPEGINNVHMHYLGSCSKTKNLSNKKN